MRLFLFVIFAGTLLAQSTPDPDEVISVPRRYVSSEGLTHQTSKAGQWLGLGREIGAATQAGLSAVVDQTERFGATKVGTFVMVMIAWKIMARDVLGVVLGIPIGMALVIF